MSQIEDGALESVDAQQSVQTFRQRWASERAGDVDAGGDGSEGWVEGEDEDGEREGGKKE